MLSTTHILGAAQKATGLSDFGDPRALEGLEHLVRASNEEARLSPAGGYRWMETLIGIAVRASEEAAPARQTISDRRLQDVLRFIEVHLSDPQLSTAMVAKGCGISPRYLSFLLRLKGTSFSELVWEQRLEKAKDWLSSSDPREISISEIAYGVGFKSPAHFSRMFKRVFKVNPREFRGECGDVPQDAFEGVLGGSELLQ